MRALFEVIKLVFEILYASYQYDIEHLQEDYHLESADSPIKLVEELNE